MENKQTISACIVAYNEAGVITRCLDSIKDLVDEIIFVHDGECSDQTIEIVKRYTDKVFVRPHAGMMEAHLVFAYKQAKSDWILRIDADEFFDQADIEKLKSIIDDDISGISFRWEMWNGERVVDLKGSRKLCLFERNKMKFCGIPHGSEIVEGKILKSDIWLRHRPKYDNTAWRSFLKKAKKWVPVNASYFFDYSKIDCFNCGIESWTVNAENIKKHIFLSLVWRPIKMFLGQMKNGLWKSRLGISISLQQFVYYFMLYANIWKLKRK